MSRPDPTQIQPALDHLRRLAGGNDGRVPTDGVRAVAQRFGCTERTVWRWLADGVPEQVAPKTLSRSDLVAIAGASGNLKAAWTGLHGAGEYPKGYRQFVRDFDRLDPMTMAALTGGVPAATARGLYLKGTSTGRLDRVIFDHTMADIRLQREFRGRLEMFRPWLTFLLDAHTRVILSCIVTEGDGVGGDPTTESLVAMMATAIRGEEAADGTFVGGVPRLVQFDNAKAHLAEAMVKGYLELGIATHAIHPASPWEDGRVERLMRTMTGEFLATLPGYTGALADRYNHEPWRPEDCLTAEEFTVLLQEWIDSYNYERRHSALGTTPFAAWKADTTPIERVADDLVRHGFLAEARGRSVSKNGIRFRGIDYVHGKLAPVVGKKVHVRYLPNDRTFIDVYLDGAYLCTAEPHERLTRDERIKIVRARNSTLGKVDRLIKQSRRRAEIRELEGNPLASPNRDPATPVTPQSPDDDAFLAFAERSISPKGAGQ